MKHPEAVGGLPASADDKALKKRSDQRFWQRYFNFYDTLNEAIPYRQMIERHAELLEPRPGELILDAGTGTGNVAKALLNYGPRVIGIDFCEPALDICRRKAPGADFRFGDLTQRLEFDSDHFDKVACCCVFHVLSRESQEFAVRELFRVLKGGGTIAVTAFANGFSPARVYVETVREQRKTANLLGALAFVLRYSFNTLRIVYYVSRIKRREKSGEYNFFSRESLVRMMEEAGFEVRDVEKGFADQCVTVVATKPAAPNKEEGGSEEV